MDELSKFCKSIEDIISKSEQLCIDDARIIVKQINEFLYTNYPEIGSTVALGNTFVYFSDFHKYWEHHYSEILDAKIDEIQCEKVAEALHRIFVRTNGNAFKEVYNTCGLSKEDICKIRFLTANQDFRGSRNFEQFANIFNSDPGIFDKETILNNPDDFVKSLKISNLSQNDKRIQYAKNVSQFLIENKCEPYGIIDKFNRNVYSFRNAIVNYSGAGYGNKKTDMFIRDMIVLNIWDNVTGFEKIDVASDINTIKVALRTGILKTVIPLVSSFIDIFCYQYGYIDEMNAKAWRTVWEKWYQKYPTECISSPCLMDYFVYEVIGKQFCKEKLYVFECETKNHTFKWHSPQNKRCQVCYKNGDKNIKANVIGRKLPCSDSEGKIVISHTPYVEQLQENQKIDTCPFKEICEEYNKKELVPPKSISILGQTGWSSAYAQKDNGGGGLMA